MVPVVVAHGVGEAPVAEAAEEEVVAVSEAGAGDAVSREEI